MRVRLGWLLGSVSAVVEGPNREEFLNRCAALGANLWTMEQMDEGRLRVTAAGRTLPLLRRAAEESTASQAKFVALDIGPTGADAGALGRSGI